MLSFNNKRFAETTDEFVNSLFDRNSTCVGYYQLKNNHIILMDQQRRRVGVVTQDAILSTVLYRNRHWCSTTLPFLIGDYSAAEQKEDINRAMRLLNRTNQLKRII